MIHDDAKLNEIAQAVTTVMYETAEQYGITRADLAAVAILVAGNIGFAALGGGCIEHLRDAADIFEQQLLRDKAA